MTALVLALFVQGDGLSAEETRAFMKKLAEYVHENHLKKDPRSEQKGMIYEYFDTTGKGRPGQWVQGEALDTMHDGAWFARGLVNAYRATGDEYYKSFLTEWVLPFYCKMLNHSDTLFSARQDDVAPSGHRFGREHQLQEGEKGFVPYYWDDGASVSLESTRKKSGKGAFSCTDKLAGQPNPEGKLSGWSHGSSNHKAQDLGVMLQQAWLLLRTPELAEAAMNLQECRTRHGAGGIPACLAPAGLANGKPEFLKRIGEPKGMDPSNHYTRCLAPPDPKKDQATPGFADDQEYHYNAGIARAGGQLPRPLAFQLIYDAYTHPMLVRYWSDSKEVPPGMNRFDLAGVPFAGGKPKAYRSDRDVGMGSRFGPQNMIVCGWSLQALQAYPGLWEERVKQFPSDLRVKFGEASEEIELGNAKLKISSRRSALVVAGAGAGESLSVRIYAQPDSKGSYADVTVRRNGAIEAVNDAGEGLRATGRVNGGDFTFEFVLPYTVAKGQKAWANGIEHFRYTVGVGEARRNFYLASTEAEVRREMFRELGEGLRTWRGVFEEKGYIPTGIGMGPHWDRFSDSGGYAHLLAAGAQWLFTLEGKREWELQNIPPLLR